MIYIFIIFSFYLEGLCSMVMKTSIFIPLFTLMSFVFTYPYFRKFDTSFFRMCFIIGILYDIVYTNTIFVHGFLFYILANIISILYRFFDKHFWTLLFMNFIVIVLYQIFNFILFLLSGRIKFTFDIFIDSIFCSLGNIIYVMLLYGIFCVFDKYKGGLLHR